MMRKYAVNTRTNHQLMKIFLKNVECNGETGFKIPRQDKDREKNTYQLEYLI